LAVAFELFSPLGRRSDIDDAASQLVERLLLVVFRENCLIQVLWRLRIEIYLQKSLHCQVQGVANAWDLVLFGNKLYH
jgi:hypothetical protein